MAYIGGTNGHGSIYPTSSTKNPMEFWLLGIAANGVTVRDKNREVKDFTRLYTASGITYAVKMILPS